MKLQIAFVLVAILACLLQSQSSFLRREFNDELDDYLTDAERTLMHRAAKKIAEAAAKNSKKIGAAIGSGAYTANEVHKEVKNLEKNHPGQYVDAKKHARSLVRLMKQLDLEDEFEDLDDYERQLMMKAIKKAGPVVGAAVGAYHADKAKDKAVKGSAAMIHNTNVHNNQQANNRVETENAKRKHARKLYRVIESLLN